MRLDHELRRAAALALLGAALVISLACASPESDAGAGRDRGVEALRALPYVHWSAGADAKLRGVVLHDRERAWSGVNLYTNDRDRAYLMDMDGRRLHTWRLPATDQQHCEYAELLGGGKLAVVCVNDALFVLDAGSNVVLEHRGKVHHDIAPLADGGMVVPEKSIHLYRRRMVYFDGLAWLSPEGRTNHRWSTWDARDRLAKLHPPSPLDRPGRWSKLLARSYDYYHLNTVESLPATALGERDPRFRAGNLLLCLRNPGLLLILDRDTKQVVWSWGPGELDGPHMPTLLDDGRLLVFDNGTDRDHSRVIELDPVTLQVTWEYRADPPSAFHSKWRGSSQRLPNGDTLICDSDRGRVFEVTPGGETVWEFWNPELKGDRRRGIYRFMRVDAALVGWVIDEKNEDR
ncbi:MAG TPA: arylsulfotransferase family protein [Thermoanaerobaculia bacterium]|nr:arylsulfotransferase family protein [Thermoanaerobaculia bacterium]